MNANNKARFKELYFADQKLRYPSIPYHCIPQPKLTENSANSLTQLVKTWINLNNGQCERINTQGRRKDNTKIVTDWMGVRTQIGSVQWVKGTGTVGSADLSAIIKGRSIKIEIKWKLDRQSEAQKLYQESVERAGGVYILCRTMDGFLEWYDEFILNC